uniref:Uncharacterized protein n=1 Tax=Anguilla anguilla TaxID=7936 RepID=A0A0E9TAX1_ANGAN
MCAQDSLIFLGGGECIVFIIGLYFTGALTLSFQVAAFRPTEVILSFI